MRYVEARLEESNRDKAYRIYVSKSLQLIPQNKYLQKDLVDMIKPDKENERSAGDVMLDVMSRAGLKFA